MSDETPKSPAFNRESLASAKTVALLALIREHVPNMIAMQPSIAECRKASFDAHVAAGFNDKQALALCVKTSFE